MKESSLQGGSVELLEGGAPVVADKPGPDKTQGPGGFSWCEGLPPTDPSEWGQYFFWNYTWNVLQKGRF